MTNLFKPPALPNPAAPTPPPPQPDPFSPAALAQAKQQAAQRAGRSSNIFPQSGNRAPLASGARDVPYSGYTLGGGR